MHVYCQKGAPFYYKYMNFSAQSLTFLNRMKHNA